EWRDDDGTLKPYPKDLSDQLEQAEVGDKWTYEITKVQSDKATQKNAQHSNRRERVVLRKTVQIVFTDLPDWWDSSNKDIQYLQVNWKKATTAAEKFAMQAANEFYSTLDKKKYEIVAIYIIQNWALWGLHMTLESSFFFFFFFVPTGFLYITGSKVKDFLVKQKIFVTYGMITEKVCHFFLSLLTFFFFFLFQTTIGFIFEQKKKSFLRDYNKTFVFGKGVYFAKDARYSVVNEYAKFDNPDGHAELLYCRVICGESVRGDKNCLRPPDKQNVKVVQEYETMINDDASIFVTCNDNQSSVLIFFSTSLIHFRFCFVAHRLSVHEAYHQTIQVNTRGRKFVKKNKSAVLFKRKQSQIREPENIVKVIYKILFVCGLMFNKQKKKNLVLNTN
ncbi:poly (ADP-ribose) polymerase family, member 11 isoform 2, partial [Reticulomyxa filosa]